jgi:hypothetical protein
MRTILKNFARRPPDQAGHRCQSAAPEERGRLSAVHFVRFAFPPAAVSAFVDSPVHLVVDHPAECARVELSSETKAELLKDLRG